SADETAKKLTHARNGAGPRTCATIRTDLDGKDYCATCLHWQTIASPIVLGEPAPSFSFSFDEYTSQNSHNSQLPVPDFPTNTLPRVGLEIVEEGAAALDRPTDVIGVPLLALTAGVIGNTQRLQLKPGYTQRPLLWTAVIAEPGTAKSPAQDIVETCVADLQ